jgi:hypothetical protein
MAELKNWLVRATREGRPGLLMECNVWSATAERAAWAIGHEPGVIILSVEPRDSAAALDEVAA